MTVYIVVLVTVPSEKVALAISRKLVNRKLAACVNIIPKVRSIYTWKKKLCDDKELLLVIKSRRRLWDKIVREVKAGHPYEVPEIIALPIQAGDKAYLNWLRNAMS